MLNTVKNITPGGVGVKGQVAPGGCLAAARVVLDPAGIPEELKALPQWVVWRCENRKGKVTKVPCDAKAPTRLASSTAPSTWSTFNQALAAHQTAAFDGVGFVFAAGGGLFGVDLDGCRNPVMGAVEPWAVDIMSRLNTYCEVSVSGRGIHVIGKGRLPSGSPTANRRRKGNIEMYDAGRYFCVTGVPLNGQAKPVADRQAEVAALHAEVFGPPEPAGAAPAAEGAPSAEAGPLALRADAEPPAEKFAALMSNDTRFAETWNRKRVDLHDQSASAYDLALADVAAAANWTAQEIANLIIAWRRKHGQDVKKALRKDYISRTLIRARSKNQTGAAPSMESPEALALVRQMLNLAPARVIRRVSGDESTFLLEMSGGVQLDIGEPATILSGAKLQARLMGLAAPYARMIPRHKPGPLQKLGTALLSICEVITLPGNAELTQEHVTRMMDRWVVLPVAPDNPDWFLCDRGTSPAFSATGPVLGCRDDTGDYPRVYVSLTAVEENLRLAHIQCSGKTLGRDLAHCHWRNFQFQHRDRKRRLWRSPPGFWHPLHDEARRTAYPATDGR
jgi:hypothetical protein